MSNNRTLGGVALLMALGLAGFGWGLVAPFAYEPVGPRAFPLITAVLIGACGLVLIAQGGGRVEPNDARVNIGLLAIAVTLLVYAVVFVTMGFVVATAAMTLAVARIFGASWPHAAVSAVVLSVGAYLLFDHALDVVLPKGIMGDWL